MYKLLLSILLLVQAPVYASSFDVEHDLKRKYKICDKFIDVTWINKEGTIGYAKNNPNELGGPEWIMVAVNDNGYLIYELNKIYDEYNEKMESFLRGAEFTIDQSYRFIKIKNNGIKREIWSSYRVLKSFNQKINICLEIPKRKIAWVFSIKKVRYAWNKSKAKQVLNEILDSKDIQLKLRDLNMHTIYDINKDGVDDYFCPACRWITLSNGSKYVQKDTSECIKKRFRTQYLLSDGKNILIGNNHNMCNISNFSSFNSNN